MLDEKITAARALSHFPQAAATEALMVVLRTEQDDVLRTRAAESLAKITGKDIPPDTKAWDNYLHGQRGKDEVAGPTSHDHFLQLIGGKD